MVDGRSGKVRQARAGTALGKVALSRQPGAAVAVMLLCGIFAGCIFGIASSDGRAVPPSGSDAVPPTTASQTEDGGAGKATGVTASASASTEKRETGGQRPDASSGKDNSDDHGRSGQASQSTLPQDDEAQETDPPAVAKADTDDGDVLEHRDEESEGAWQSIEPQEADNEPVQDVQPTSGQEGYPAGGQAQESNAAAQEQVQDGREAPQQPAQEEQPQATITVAVTVSSNAVGNPVSHSAQVQIPEGGSVYDALAACGIGIDVRPTQYGMYVAAIEGLAERQHGGSSGWVYEVNGARTVYAADAYILSDGDSVSWFYVT